MRWVLGRDPGSCTGCGAGLERGAVWCGACGARVDTAVGRDGGRDGGRDEATTEPAGPAVDDGPDRAAGADDRSGRRRAVAGAVGLAVAALVAATVLRPAPPEPLLGQVGLDTGVTATAAPPVGLRPAWERERPRADEGSASSFGPPITVVAADGRVRVDDVVVDVDSGRVVGAGGALGDAEGPVGAAVQEGALVTVDTLTGAVVDRADLEVDVVDRPDVGSLVTRDVAVLRVAAPSGPGGVAGAGAEGVESTLLVRSDGTVVAEVDGVHLPYLDPVAASPAAVPLRQPDVGAEGDGSMLPIRLVATATGEEVFATGDDARVRVAQVHGHVAIVAETGGVLGEPGATGASWQVRVLDATTGQLRQRVSTSSAEPPRLVGVADDGTAVLASRIGFEVRLASVTPQGAVADVGVTRATDLVMGDDPFSNRAGSVAAVAGDLVVTLRDGEAVATALDGTVRWRAGSDAERLATDGGYVALVGPTSVQLVEAADGRTVTSFDRGAPRFVRQPAALGVVDGHVGVAQRDTFGSGPQLGATSWFALTDGRPAPFDDLFAPRDGGPTGSSLAAWRFHGTIAADDLDRGAAGGVRPVVTFSEGRTSLEVLDPGAEPRRVRLPSPDATSPFGDLGQVRGVAPGRLAVVQYGFSGETQQVVTHVVDVADSEVTSIDGWEAVLLTEDTLLAVAFDDEDGTPRMAAFDAVTGDRRWVGSALELFGRSRHDASSVVSTDPLGVRMLRLDDGATSWRRDVGTVLADLRPVLTADRVVVATATGEVVALDRGDGSEVWRSDVGAPVTSLAGAGADTLVGTLDGLVVHLGADGQERQRVAVANEPVVDVATLGATTVAVSDGAVTGLRADGDGVTSDDEVDLP